MAKQRYARLMSGPSCGDPFDRHLFACAISLVQSTHGESLTHGLGLSEECLAALVGRYFPHAPGLLDGDRHDVFSRYIDDLLAVAALDGPRPIGRDLPR